jgi:hypothetical protein
MGEPNAELTLNQKVLTWAQGRLGKKVGKGECWDLGEQALQQAGAQTSNDLGPVTDDADYVWGDAIALKDIQPGDILQIRDHVIVTTTTEDYTFKDGSGREQTSETKASRGHHTAIVNGQPDANGAVRTLEQHVKPKGDIVQQLRLHTRDVPKVVTKVYEKRRNPNTKKDEMVEITKTTTVEVTGTIWAYRPKPK